MDSKLKVGDYVIVPADIRGTGETIKAMVLEKEPGILGSAPLVTCLYIEPAVNALGESRLVCYEDQLQRMDDAIIAESKKGGDS